MRVNALNTNHLKSCSFSNLLLLNQSLLQIQLSSGMGFFFPFEWFDENNQSYNDKHSRGIGGKKTVEMSILFFDIKFCLSCLRVTELGLLTYFKMFLINQDHLGYSAYQQKICLAQFAVYPPQNS